jgi:sphingosine kinase
MPVIAKIKPRKRIALELTFSKFSTYEENLLYVNNWHNQLDVLNKSLLYELWLKSVKPSNSSHHEVVSRVYHEKLFKPFLVFINPKSGSGKAKTIYYERVVPVWSESNQQNIIVFTEHANHAYEYMQTVKIDDYRGIIVISGDGLVYEVINGLMNRPDWRLAIKVPIAQIPGGSANAFACSCAYLTNECFLGLSMEKLASQTAFNMAKSNACPLDLVTFQLCSNKLVHSFLEFEWAIVADIDLESEKYRFLGGLRFTVSAIKRIINLRVYRGRLTFLLQDPSDTFTPKDTSIKVIKSTNPNNINNNNNINEDDENRPRHVTNLDEESLDKNRPAFKYLPDSLDAPLPGSDWITIEENFVFFLISYLPLIAPDFLSAPQSKFNDECMHLTFIREGISKTQLLKLFTDTENGEHIKSPFVEYARIKAFRLEPLVSCSSSSSSSGIRSPSPDDGVMMIDGERVPYGKLQAEIMPGLANVLANQKC